MVAHALCPQTPPLGTRWDTEGPTSAQGDATTYSLRSFMMMRRNSRNLVASFMGLLKKSAGFLCVGTN
jgi:hypothetical protein